MQNESEDELKQKLEILDSMIRGEYMQPFQPFFGPKEQLPPLSQTEIAYKEKVLTSEIRDSIL